MRALKSLTMVLGLGVFIVSIPLAAKADEWNKATKLTFNQPVEIPGMVLAPGTYVFKLADSVDRNVVQIYNADETHLYKNVLTIPSYRMEPTDKTVVTFEERAQGTPEAVKDWFYPGNYYGAEFIYPGISTTPVAQTSAPPAAVHQTNTAAVLPPQAAVNTPTPTNEPVQIAQAATQPQPVATPAATAPAQTQAPKKLPRTASALPILAFVGLLSLAGSAGMQVFSKRTS